MDRTSRTVSRRRFVQGSAVGLGWIALGASAWSAQDVPDADARSAFLRAVVAGDLDAVRHQVADVPGLVHACDDAGQSAFLVASLHRHEAIASHLRGQGHVLDLHELAFRGEWEAFDTLASKTEGAVNAFHPVGGTAMVAAALGGVGSSIWHVHAQGGDPNLRPDSPRAMSPVRAALEHPDLAVAEVTAAALLANDAPADTAEPGGTTLLHVAAARGSVDLVEMLIRKGAAVDARDTEGRVALAVAAEAKHLDVVSVLRHHRRIPRDHNDGRASHDFEGKRYRAPDAQGLAPAQGREIVGLAHGNFDNVRARVKAEPRLAHAQATTGERAVEASGHMGRKAMVDFLLEGGAPYALTTAVMRGDLTTVRRRLADDPRCVHERGPHDFALLWYPIIAGGDLELANVLLDAGADPERQHHMGTTALHWAAMRGQRDMAALLIERGANVGRRGRKFGAEPQTPLDLARARDHGDVVALLRDRGAR